MRAVAFTTLIGMISATALAIAWSYRIKEIDDITRIQQMSCVVDNNTIKSIREVIEVRLRDPDTSKTVKIQFRRIERNLLQFRKCPY
jgi:hypothetical protein